MSRHAPRSLRARSVQGAEAGGATVLALASAGVLVLVLVAGLVLAAVVVAAHRASVAADLASLAAAVHLGNGATPSEACGRSEAVAAANGTRLESCLVASDASVTVTTGARAAQVLRGWDDLVVRARARAGPEPGG